MLRCHRRRTKISGCLLHTRLIMREGRIESRQANDSPYKEAIFPGDLLYSTLVYVFLRELFLQFLLAFFAQS